MDGVDAAGGSRELANLIDKYGEFLIPDLKREYGIDLRDLFSEENPISPAFVLIHIKTLPMGSPFMAEVRGGQHYRGWDEGRYMEAAQLNTNRGHAFMYLTAHSDPKKSKPKPPTPWPLPDDQDKKKEKVHKPGSFAAIALARLAAVKKLKEGGVI